MSAATDPSDRPEREAERWTFLTNHAHVLVSIERDPWATMREVADRVGVTERAVQRIVRDLERAGVLARTREGRRNVYRVDPTRPLRHPVESHRTVGDLLELINLPLRADKAL